MVNYSTQLHTLELGPMENFIYLIEDCATATAAVVDPAWEVEKIIDYAAERKLKITTIILTHGHNDHINGVESLQQKSGAKVYINTIEAKFFGLENMDWSSFNAPFKIDLGSTEILAVETPGHTPGGVCYYTDGNLITGDTLFVYGCGRCDLDGSDPVAMFHSLHGLLDQFDPETRVFPGHNYSIDKSSTLKQERAGNPFMHFDDEESFTKYRMELHDQTRSAPYGPMENS